MNHETEAVQMPLQYRIVKENGTGEIEEKKSRFIANVRLVTSEAEALAFIEEMRKKYWDARHNCYAYIVGTKQELMRYSDDGEPGGTAGKPILEVLLGEKLCNTVIVVTRYFGGTLLGTGGLVRAYTQAAQAGLRCSGIVQMCLGKVLVIKTDYNGMGKIRYMLEKKEITIKDILYEAEVEMQVIVPAQQWEDIRDEVTELTSGQAKVREAGEEYFPEKKVSHMD